MEIPVISINGTATNYSVPPRLTICLNLKRLAPTFFGNFNFNSFCELGGFCLGANEQGIYTIGGGDDNGDPIPAEFEMMTTDLGIANMKRFRSVYLGYETDGTLTLTVKDDDGNERSYDFSPTDTSNRSHSDKVIIGRGGIGRYWSFKISNNDGARFRVDSIKALPIILGRKPR